MKFFRTLFSWFVFTPLVLVLVVFAVNNKQDVTISLWPFPFEAVTPVYVVVLAVFLLGFLFGSLYSFVARLTKKQKKKQKNDDAGT